MGKRFWAWAGWFLFLFVVDFSVPFLFFRGIPTLAGSFLFWVVWTLVAMASMFAIFLPWREPENPNQGGDHE